MLSINQTEWSTIPAYPHVRIGLTSKMCVCCLSMFCFLFVLGLVLSRKDAKCFEMLHSRMAEYDCPEVTLYVITVRHW